MTVYEIVKKDFLSGRIKGCRAYFEGNHCYLEAGYCFIILDRLDKAKIMFENVEQVDIRAKWGLFLIQMLENNIKSCPTYFQIRNFLEIDLGILLLYLKEKYVERIIKYADFMAYYNPECYKFIGRAFWANKLHAPAMFFLNRAKDKLYKDPELHYLLAYIYYHEEKNISLCKKSLDICLELLPQYAPAKNLYKLVK